MPLVVLGVSHHQSSVSVRERFALAEAQIPEALQRLRQSGAAQEAVILSTCNRVEIYAVLPDLQGDRLQQLKNFFLQNGSATPPAETELFMLSEPESIEHLFKVASGLDSMVLGETEILGQVKKAYELARSQRHTGKQLNQIFQKAFNVAKQIRTETQIQRGSVSVGSVAVELAEKIFSSLSDRQVMIIGAGETSEKTARALLSRGARSILVSNRSYDRAEALAAELGGRAVRFEDWAGEFHKIDIVISSTSAPHYILDRAKLEGIMKLRKNRSLLLVDIAVPRDIDPEVNYLDNVYLYNIDDLKAIADDYLKQRQEEIARCEAIIRDKITSMTAHPGRRAVPGSGDWALNNPSRTV